MLRKNDYTGYNNYYDLWLFDEFHEATDENSSIIGATEMVKCKYSILSTLLTGNIVDWTQSMDAYLLNFGKSRSYYHDCKQITSRHERGGTFQVIRLQFATHIEDLFLLERVIPTLWGCVKRRLNQIEANVDSAKGIYLHYNKDPVYLKILTENKHKPFVFKSTRNK